MWNHSMNSNKKAPGFMVDTGRLRNGDFLEMDNDEKVEKSLDLANYHAFLTTLFNEPTSDSEQAEEDLEIKDQNEAGKDEILSPSPSDIHNQSKFLSSVAAESTNSSSSSNSDTSTRRFSTKVKSRGALAPPNYPLKSRSVHANDNDTTDSSSSSTSSSSFSSEDDGEGDEGHNSIIPSEMAPLSDLELSNLLKKTNYPLDVDQPINFDGEESTTESTVKKGKKKKKKSKKKQDGTMYDKRQNKPNSGPGGRGNGPSKGGFGGDSGGGPGTDSGGSSNSTGFDSNSKVNSGGGSSMSKGRARKQSLKLLRSEDAASASSSEGSFKIGTLNSVIAHRNLTISSGISTSTSVMGFSGVLKNQHGPFNSSGRCSSILVCSNSNNDILNNNPSGLPGHLRGDDKMDDDDDDDDNDSLSDYMSMAATAANAMATAQVPPLLPQLPLCPSTSNGFYKYANDDMIRNGFSVETASSSSCKSSITSGDSSVVKSRVVGGSKKPKRKRESPDGKPETARSKKALVLKQQKLIELLNIKRRKVYVYVCKKEIAKPQRTMLNVRKEMLTVKRRLAQACTRYVRQKAIQSQKVMKESVWRAKRLTREMQAHWKQADRIERENRKRKEKEAEEQRKQDVELMEAKRHQRKLNFVITQTELYAHFMAKKLSGLEFSDGGKESEKILGRLSDERSTGLDDYDGNTIKMEAKSNVLKAFEAQQAQVNHFNVHGTVENSKEHLTEYSQPELFKGVLKQYQLNGMNWLIHLYDQGINGILADEMGLGKTVQSIAFLAHVAERYKVWGPFLIIAPASTLHNWQQELNRFVSDFKVIPYWGNPQERKILRQFWQQNNIHSPEASFHVVVTSYQIVMADLKSFNRIKWQYLILDEAQAIKSTASARWKMLLGFSCRNRLLLTGTPIQNTMGELWALLHFIMPSLFDSHDEFSEWFSKDIESHVENRSLMDERHLSRLHMILKPFMLRRVKKDVENELSDKIEVLVPCPLTLRQQILYTALKRKVKIEEYMKVGGSNPNNLSTTNNLLNLVMQFRKVCNHPELFERCEVKSPFFMKSISVQYPKLIFREGLLAKTSSDKLHLLENKFSVFNPVNTHRSIFGSTFFRNAQPTRSISRRKICVDVNSGNVQCEWSFLRFSGLSSGDMWKLYCDGILERLRYLVKFHEESSRIHHARLWNASDLSARAESLQPLDFLLHSELPCGFDNLSDSDALRNFVFVKPVDTLYGFTDCKIFSMEETVEQKVLRSKTTSPYLEDPPPLPELKYKNREPEIRTFQPAYFPNFVCNCFPKVVSKSISPYFYDQSAIRWLNRHNSCTPLEGKNFLLYGNEDGRTFINFYGGGLNAVQNVHGWSYVVTKDKEKLVSDSGKLKVLDGLLKKLKIDGHRVLIYSQMTKMIDLLEEFMWYRKWTYVRLDGSSKISERRDMVADFQSRSDIFIFLLSTRAGGLGINLTAADTVIFYDSDWNPTVDQQAMDRAHRLGQTKQVTVYRLICKGTIEEKILERAREKNEIQRMVIAGSNVRPETLKTKEVLSLLLDDEELDRKYRQKQADKRTNLGHGISELKERPPSTSRGLQISPLKLIPQKLTKSTQNLDLKVKEAATDTVVDNSVNKPVEVDDTDESMDESIPSSPIGFIEADVDARDVDFQEDSECDEPGDVHPRASSYYDDYTSTMDWNGGSVSDYDEDLSFAPKKPKIGRGSGKRGRPPSRVHRIQMRDIDSGSMPIRRGPGRPRLRPIGPANQGIRGRRPGRPPLSKKAETITSSLTPSQRVFGLYSSPDVNTS